MMDFTPTVLVAATMDTKAAEVAYIKTCLNEVGAEALLMDVGIIGKSPIAVEISQDYVVRAAGYAMADVHDLKHEGKASRVMITGATRLAEELHGQGRINAIIGLGGSVGTDICTAVMRSFPIGFPKIMISTLASHDVRPFVGTKDILMFPTICDLNGINRILEKILRNASLAAAGMARQAPHESESTKPLVFIGTLGTSEPSALRIKRAVEAKGREVIIFHTTGVGGRAMEEMINEGQAEIVVEISATELVAHLLEGDYDAGPDRFSAALKRGVPTILVPGCTDFIVSGPIGVTQKQFPNRQYHRHNAAITAVRTTHEEAEAVARAMAKLCNEATGPRVVAVPLGGLSGFDRIGGPIYDPEAPKIMAEVFKSTLGPETFLHVSPHHINDPEFGELLIDIVLSWIGS
jgi:uncharacterized protein (UPF0261 family)